MAALIWRMNQLKLSFLIAGAMRHPKAILAKSCWQKEREAERKAGLAGGENNLFIGTSLDFGLLETPLSPALPLPNGH